MPLSWNEIKSNAIAFSKDWENVERESAEAKPFWEAFFEVFGLKRRLYATFEEPVRKQKGGKRFIDLFWPGMLMVEHKSKGESLEKAKSQAFLYIQGLESIGRREELPRYLVLSDFERFHLIDLDESRSFEFPLKDLHRHIHLFGFMAGYEVHEPHEEDPANFEAVLLLANLRDALGTSGYEGHDLERFLVRILFCLFAENTGIIERDGFSLYLKNSTKDDGSDTGLHLSNFFAILDTPPEKRAKNLDPLLAGLPFVNGGLFEERLAFPVFDRKMRDELMRCALFDWSKISPVIFGSLFQSVMEPADRRHLGGHYTSERDIMRLIRSLFLDELISEFKKAKRSKRTLQNFHQMLGTLRFLDPACGCGNFLVVAYRELRRLEIEVLDALYPADRHGRRQVITDIGLLSVVDVDCMHGIEISEFPSRIAEVAMWLIDHQMNLLLAGTFGQYFVRLPLRKSAKIVTANALRSEWSEVIAPQNCSFILGNPPFIGGKYQDATQKDDLRMVAGHIPSFGLLDYVAGWYVKAMRFLAENTEIRAAFVSTNSITQGEQVGVLWPYLLRHGVRIHFAHRTFKWISEARGRAHVHVVIVGFGLKDREPKFIFDYHSDGDRTTVLEARDINPYLTDASNIVVTKSSKPLWDTPPISFGNMPNDKGYLLFRSDEMAALLEEEPDARPYLRPFLGSEEFINGTERYCLWLTDVSPTVLRSLPTIMERARLVREARLASTRKATQKLASVPLSFGEIRQPSSTYLGIPKTSSERRRFIPMTFLPPTTIASSELFTCEGATHFHFGVLTSSIHMAWVRHVCGRLKSDFRYSARLVYNNFPWPECPTKAAIWKVEECAKAILNARQNHPGSSLADLYDPLTMPVDLLKAHQTLDRAVDKLYRKRPFEGDMDRFAYLIELYRKKIEGIAAVKSPKRRTKRKA